MPDIDPIAVLLVAVIIAVGIWLGWPNGKGK